MAGLGPFGFGGPIGTIGPRGMDVSPWFQTQQLQLQRQRDWQDQLAQQQQMQQFQQQLGLSQAAQDFNRKIAELELQQSGARDAFNQRQRVSELQAVERESEKEDKYRAERDKVSDLRVASAQEVAQQQYELAKAEEARRAESEQAEREGKAAAKKEAEEKRKAGEGVVQVGTRARGIVIENAKALAARMAAANNGNPPSLEAVRDAMMVEASKLDVTPDERAVVQQAVQEWYDNATAQEQEQQATREREKAETEKAAAKTRAELERDAERESRKRAEPTEADRAKLEADVARKERIEDLKDAYQIAKDMGDEEAAKEAWEELKKLLKA